MDRTFASGRLSDLAWARSFLEIGDTARAGTTGAADSSGTITRVALSERADSDVCAIRNEPHPRPVRVATDQPIALPRITIGVCGDLGTHHRPGRGVDALFAHPYARRFAE